MSETNEVAWRLGRYQWLPNCSEERQRWVNTEHDIMFFRIDIGFRPIVCYEVDSVEVYEPPNRANALGTWYVAVKRLIKITAYNERFIVRVTRREPVPLLRIEDVVFHSPSIGYVGITAPFNVEVVKRVVRFAEEVNRMPNYTADLVTVSQDGYSLHVIRRERSGKRMIETSLVLNFDKEGKLKSDVANRYTLMSMDLPISLWVRGDEA